MSFKFVEDIMILDAFDDCQKTIYLPPWFESKYQELYMFAWIMYAEYLEGENDL